MPMPRWFSAGLLFLLTTLASAPRGIRADEKADGGLSPPDSAEVLSPPAPETRAEPIHPH